MSEWKNIPREILFDDGRIVQIQFGQHFSKEKQERFFDEIEAAKVLLERKYLIEHFSTDSNKEILLMAINEVGTHLFNYISNEPLIE